MPCHICYRLGPIKVWPLFRIQNVILRIGVLSSAQIWLQEVFSAILLNRSILTIYSPYILQILVDYFRLFGGSSCCIWFQLSLGSNTAYWAALNSWNWPFVFIHIWVCISVTSANCSWFSCGFFCGTTEGFSDVNLLTDLLQKTFSIKQCLALTLIIFLLWDMGGRLLVDKICHKVKNWWVYVSQCQIPFNVSIFKAKASFYFIIEI